MIGIKKFKYIWTMLLCCFTAAIALTVTGCGDKNTDPPEPDDILIALAVPSVVVDANGTASWNAVANASGYAYKINDGAETPTDVTHVSLTNEQSIRVKAVGDGVKFSDSAYSEAVTFTETVEKPTTADIKGTTEPGATVTLTTDVNTYTTVAENGVFTFGYPTTEKPLALVASKLGYFSTRVEITDPSAAYKLTLTGSVRSSAPEMQIDGDDFSTLRCSYYNTNGGNVGISFTDPAKDGQVIKFSLATFGEGDGKRAHGASSDGTPVSNGVKGMSDADLYLGVKVGGYTCRFLSDGIIGIDESVVSNYLPMFTALSGENDETDFAIAFDGGKTYYFVKQPSDLKYLYVGSNNAKPSAVELIVACANAFTNNFEFRKFAVEDSAQAFMSDALTDSEFFGVNSAIRRNADGSVSAVIGNGASSGYLYDRSRAYDLSGGTLTLKTKIYSYGGLWQFHGFYIVDAATDKHYNIGIAQGNNIWLSWSNGDRDFNGFPGRVPISNTACPGTFGSYNAHGGWVNSNTAEMFEAELKLVLNGELADLFLNGKRIVRTDVRELFDKNITCSGGAAGAASTDMLPSDNVYVGLYAFSDPCKYRTLFDDFTVTYDGLADMERAVGDTPWTTQVYYDGTPLDRGFILSGAISMNAAAANAKTAFRFGNNDMGLLAQQNGKITVACGMGDSFVGTGNDNDIFDRGDLDAEFELAVDETRAALFIDGALRLVYNGIDAKELFEFYSQGANVTVTGMQALLPDSDGYSARMAEISELITDYAADGFASVESSRMSKPIITVSDDGAVTVTQAENAAMVYSIDGGRFRPYTDGIVLEIGQRITVKALGNGQTLSSSQNSAVYYAFETTANGDKVSVSKGDGKITVETTAEARGEVFILVLKNKDDIYSWLFGGALAMAQTAADGNGAVAAEIVVDVPTTGAWVFVITENAAYAVEVK